MAESNPLLTSKEVLKALKISSCDLMHMREAGKLTFEKKGNAYMYHLEDVKKEQEKKETRDSK
jgi:hypothetical protein